MLDLPVRYRNNPSLTRRFRPQPESWVRAVRPAADLGDNLDDGLDGDLDDELDDDLDGDLDDTAAHHRVPTSPPQRPQLFGSEPNRCLRAISLAPAFGQASMTHN